MVDTCCHCRGVAEVAVVRSECGVVPAKGKGEGEGVVDVNADTVRLQQVDVVGVGDGRR